MAAKIIPEQFIKEPDITVVEAGGLDSIGFQDCANIVRAFERGVNNSSSEAAIFAPLSRTTQNIKYWSMANQKILGSWLVDPDKIKEDSQSVTGEKFSDTFTSLRDKDFGDALKNALEDCVPCEDRVNLLLTFVADGNFLSIFENDIKEKIKLLQELDSLLGNVDSYGEICSLLGFLNFLCIPDLQRMIATLMALLMQFNIQIGGLFSLVAALIVPLFSPILSGITNLLNQFVALVISPITCVLDALRAQASKIPDVTRSSATIERADEVPGSAAAQVTLSDQQKTSTTQALKSGLLLIEEQLVQAVEAITAKAQFYMDQLRKALTDWNGDSNTLLLASMKKLQIVRTISLIAAIIDLKRKGTDLCKQGTNPSASQLDNFFKNFLNPNSFFKLAIDDDGNINIEEPDPLLYQLEEPNNGAKIISYEPDDLLQRPVSVTFTCASLGADIIQVDKLNKYIREINSLSNI